MDTANIEFTECDTCRTKPGTPSLCQGCLRNRAAINELKAQIKRLESEKNQLSFGFWENEARNQRNPGY